MAKLNLVQQGAELAYLLLHDPQCRGTVRKEHLWVVYVGDGSSDLHVMLHVNMRDGFTIAVSEARHVSQVAKRTVLASNALSVLVPILEDIVRWPRLEIRDFFERYGFLIQEWESVRTDWLTLRPSNEAATLKPTISEAKKADMPPRRARGPSRDHDGEVCFRTF